MLEIDVGRMRPFPCFRDFDDEERLAAAKHLESVRLAAGQKLFRQGEPGDATFLLVAGQVDIVFAVAGQVDHTYLLQPGAIFGEVAPLLGSTRSGSAVARGDVELWRLPYASLRGALAGGEAWAGKMLLANAQTLARRLVALDREMTQALTELRRQSASAPRAAELEAMRKRLMTEWAF